MTRLAWGRAWRIIDGRIPPQPARMAMADLTDRVQSVLGDAYRVERELPPGGMSRLFLATELQPAVKEARAALARLSSDRR